MSNNDYGGALNLKDIDKKVVTPLDKYLPYFCPLEHTEYNEECPSCTTLYGDHRRDYNV
tara:strand:+ start:100 stop:276 length:177 start_codon:yes stop_codon:yes gene_type:complete